MGRWLRAGFLLALGASLCGCATRGGGGGAYAYGGGAFLDDCEFVEDCYGGRGYTCVFYQPYQAAAPARLDINLAARSRSPRVVEPRDTVLDSSRWDSGSGSSPMSGSAS